MQIHYVVVYDTENDWWYTTDEQQAFPKGVVLDGNRWRDLTDDERYGGIDDVAHYLLLESLRGLGGAVKERLAERAG